MNFKKRVNGSWVDTPHYIHNTSTDTITTLPAVLYPNAATVTVGLKGNTVQSGTPTPDSPIMPEGCGDLETVGAKAGQYKIPISSGGVTTNVYLGEVQTTRKIRKLVLTGNEDFALHPDVSNLFRAYFVTDYLFEVKTITCCSHYVGAKNSISTQVLNGTTAFYYGSDTLARLIYFRDNRFATADAFKAYLAQQYAAGTPVTVWYVLATEETGIVNEPLMKIGDYADTLSNISIPVTAGGDTLSVDTTVQPSEVTVNYKGWHSVQNVHEAEQGNNLFDYTTMATSVENGYLKPDGTIGASNDWNISGYIPCNGTSFTIGYVGGNTPAICLYDKNKQFITGKAYNTGGASSKQAINITSQDTAKYIRFSYCKASGASYDNLSAIMLNKGSSLLPIEPYGTHWD